MDETLPLDSLLSFLEGYEGVDTQIPAEAVEQLKGLLMKYMQDADEIKTLTDKIEGLNRQITELNEAVRFLSTTNNFSATSAQDADEHHDLETIQHQLKTNQIVTDSLAHQGAAAAEEQSHLERKIMSKWNMKIKTNEKVLEDEISRLKQQQDALSVLNQQLQSQLSVVAQERDELMKDLKNCQGECADE